MPISIDALKALAASGATPEMIIAVIEAHADCMLRLAGMQRSILGRQL
jgi:hypothetical protein